MIDCIQSLSKHDRCREIPVIGIMHGMVVYGVIDQIERQNILSESPVDAHDLVSQVDDTSGSSGLKRKRTSFDASDVSGRKPKKARIQGDGLEASKGAEATGASSRSQYQLRISDTKTRSEPGMPPESDTDPPRMQLMVYRKLLSGVLAPPSSPEAVDLAAVWALLGLSPDSQLLDNFVWRAKLARYGPPHPRWTLNELVRILRQSVEELHFDRIADELDIVYCTQAETKARGGDAANTKLTVEERWPVIGTTTIRYDEQVAQGYLERAFEYWKGERLPEGAEESLMERRCL
ncbi:hypothetical protein EIP86_004704 [Pleurotus ostreatoroseus]|nr:hypothetical protein EIP86_004704 [Pleurotus ostreatoroseus]